MPRFRTLSDAEIAELSRRRPDLSQLNEYSDYLKALKDGDWGAIELAPGETQRTVKRRASTAANSLGMRIQWRPRRADEQELFFRIEKRQ